MIFAKVDVCLWSHERFVVAGPAATGLWTAALTYLRQHESSDGLVRAPVVGMLLGVGDKDGRKLADRLVQVGLFETEGRDYVLLGYAAKNETKEQIEARRAATRLRVETFRRQRAHRHGDCNDHGNAVNNVAGNSAGNAVTHLTVTGDVPGSDSLSVSVISGESARGELRNATDDGAFGMAVTAWQEGVASITGRPFPLQPGPATQSVVAAILAGCPGLPQRVDWARAKGAAWAKARAGRTLKPFDFGDWVASGEPSTSTHEVQHDPNSPARRAERKRRDAADREHMATAVPAPIDHLLKAISK